MDLKELIERGEQARAKAQLAIEWSRHLRNENREAHRHSIDSLGGWLIFNGGAQDDIGEWPPQS